MIEALGFYCTLIVAIVVFGVVIDYLGRR